jgi:hypothetical protein
MFVIHRPQSAHLPVGLVGARSSRHAVDQERLGTRLRLQLNTAWRGTALDRMLADGVDPDNSAALALRARKLTGPRGRQRIASGLAAAIRGATDTRPGFTSALRPRASELLDARTVVTALERRLRGARPVSAQGVALLATLLTDAASPLYQPSRPGELASRLRAAAVALDHPDQAIGGRGDLTGEDRTVDGSELAQRWPVTREEVGR